MKVQYSPLITLECFHSYFAKGYCDSLYLQPTAQCLQLLERYRGLFRATPTGGGIAFAKSEEMNPISQFDDELPFSFNLICTDPNFINYTDANPISGGEAIYYFSNLTRQTAKTKNADRFPLRFPNEALSNHLLPIRPKRFSYNLDSKLKNVQIKITDFMSDEPVWKVNAQNPDASNIPLDLRTLPDGHYRLNVNGKDTLDFYLTDALIANRFAVIEIFPGGPAQTKHIPGNQGIINTKGQATPKTFSLSLDNRATYWRYYIFRSPTEEHIYKNFNVSGTSKKTHGKESGNGSLQFSETEQIQIDGRSARVFISDKTIPLYEKPGEAYEIIFKSNTQSERSVKAFKLPYANGKNTRLVEIDGKRYMYSDVFVYL